MDIVNHSDTQRKNRTKKHLKSAFIELIKTKGFHAVTVKDIINYASYNRSTFYVHYQDKYELADELLLDMMNRLEASVGKNHKPGHKVYTDNLDAPSFYILTFIYEHRDFFKLITYEDTLPGLHTAFPQTILKIYMEKFTFETINNVPVNMDYFKHYTAYGFYGLIMNWIQTDFQVSQQDFIKEIINLTKTHMHAFEFKG